MPIYKKKNDENLERLEEYIENLLILKENYRKEYLKKLKKMNSQMNKIMITLDNNLKWKKKMIKNKFTKKLF